MTTLGQPNQLSNSLNEFSWELYRNLGQEPLSNIFFSPYSIMAALTMTFAGAKNNTEKQMSEVLRLTGIEDIHQSFQSLNKALLSLDDSSMFKSANRLYAQNGFSFLETFMKVTEVYYEASLLPVDFKTGAEDARIHINSWVAEQTNGMIKDLIAEGVLNPDTVLVLVNAVYFKGTWLQQFDPKRTSVQPFKVSSTEIIKVDMMFKKDLFQLTEDTHLKCQVLTLPYVGNKLSMTIVLPDESVSLDDLKANINVDVITNWSMTSRRQKVNVHLPRFKMESSFVLNDQMADMGMADLFDRNKADLSGISGTNDLYMSKVIHKAFVEVNEEGTEAAAATAAVIEKRSIEIIPTFNADHPFLFYISDNSSGSVLFVGQLARPSKSPRRDEL